MLVGVLVCTSPARAQNTVRASVGASFGAGTPDGLSDHTSVSADGRYIAFESVASNLVPGDLNASWDIFVHDRLTNTTTRASVATGGGSANGASQAPAISADGRYVAFQSLATNLAPGAGSGHYNIFVRDLVAHTTVCASVASDGTPSNNSCMNPSISADGRYVAYEAFASNLVPGDTNNKEDVFLRDLHTNTTTLVSVAADGGPSNTAASLASVSGDGRYVAFIAGDGNLVAGDTNHHTDVFIRDTVAGATIIASVAADGSASNGESFDPAMSEDGRHIAFDSAARNLVAGDTNLAMDVFVRDLATGTTVRASVTTAGTEVSLGGSHPAVSPDGRYVAFQSMATDLTPDPDTNKENDVFIRDTVAKTTTRVSMANDGSGADGDSIGPAISADGNIVAFSSTADNLAPGDANNTTDVFVRDVGAGTTSLVSVAAEAGLKPADNFSTGSSVSADGRYVAFWSMATNLVPGDTNGVGDIFVRDAWMNTTERVSVASDGTQANGASQSFSPPSISADGRYVAFESMASNLVPGDTNGAVDAFVRDRVAGTTIRVSVASDGSQANSDANLLPYNNCSISATGRYVVFSSSASNLVPGDTNNTTDVFVRDLVVNTTERVDLTSTGGQTKNISGPATPSISADGRYVAFDSLDGTLVPDDKNGTTDVFVRDRTAGTTVRMNNGSVAGSAGDIGTFDGQISADGRHVAFTSPIPNPPAGGQQHEGIFVEDLDTSAVSLISHPPGGIYPDNDSNTAAISADGRYVAFTSDATDLVQGDTNGTTDAFVADRTTGAVSRVSLADDGSQANGASDSPSLSGDGRFVAFDSLATNLVPGDTNNAKDVFLRGPLSAPAPPFALADAQAALRIAAGIDGADAATFGRLDVVTTEAEPNVVDIRDAIRIARIVAGLDH